MKFIIFFIYVPLVCSELHTFITEYTEINGKMTEETPEFSAVTSLDGQQIDYYDSDTMKLIPKQDWMEEFASEELWKKYTEIRKQVQQIYKINVHVLMEQFHHTYGVHTYQRMYGCNYDDETEDSHGFDQHAYDGENFISLDLKELRYITPVVQGLPIMRKWNNDQDQLKFLNQYYNHECVYWLNKFLALRKAEVQRIAPEVSLLQKDPSSPVMCRATGFYPSEVTITWFRNGVTIRDVDLGETLPNEDGTFQKTSTLRVTPDEWKQNRYACVVKHQEKTIRKILTDYEIKTNYRLPTRWTKLGFPSTASQQTKTFRIIHILLCVMGVFIFAL